MGGVEREAVITTIVGGRPPGCGRDLGQFPREIEVLIKKAAVDGEFRAVLLERRAEAAGAIGLELNAVETAMLAAIPREQLEQTIARTEVPEPSRRAFLGMAGAAMLAALGFGATGCSSFTNSTSKGVRPGNLNNKQDEEFGPRIAGIREELDLLVVSDIHFDTDKSDIRPDQLERLDNDLKYFKEHEYCKIMIEGHCDERGTEEYNFSLGQRRAQTVKDYLIRNGIAADRLHTISKGKDRPKDLRHIEAAWAKNRRVHFMRMN